MYSASQVDKATKFCFLDGELIAGPNSDEEKQFIQWYCVCYQDLINNRHYHKNHLIMILF